MTEWVKRLQGYVKIRVWGFAPQRFINLCSNKGILLWNIEKQEDVYTMCIGLRSFYELRPIARKTKVRVVISERYGLPFFVPGMLRRKAFLAGLFLAVAFWLISSLFVWDIQVTGNYQVTDDVFYSFLEQEGIHTGMRRSELNIGELEKQIRRKFSQVTWTSGRLDGTRLVIEVKENDMSVPEVVQDAAGAGKDLVAECNGVITDMIVRCGVPKVSIGSEVAKGDILVEGRIPIYAEDGTVREYRPVTPDADIVLEWKPEKKMDFLQYDSVLEACPVKALEYLQIPCMVGRITYREYQKTEYYYTVSEAETVLQKKIMDFLETLDEKGVQIISKDVKIETKRAGWTAHGELLLREAAVSLVDSRAEDTGAEDLDRNED